MDDEIALTLSQLDVTAMRIFVTEIGNATDNDVFELFVFCFPHCSKAKCNPTCISTCVTTTSVFYIERKPCEWRVCIRFCIVEILSIMEARYSGEVGESNGKRNCPYFIDSPLLKGAE